CLLLTQSGHAAPALLSCLLITDPRNEHRLQQIYGSVECAELVVLMHNHPGGDPTPSRADIEMTRVIVEIAKAVRYCDPGPHHRREARSRQSERTEADLNDVASLGQSGPYPRTQREHTRVHPQSDQRMRAPRLYPRIFPSLATTRWHGIDGS